MKTEIDPSVLVVIPARGGSKGIPGKNLATVGSHPLVGRAIRTALAARLPTVVVVSTDDTKIGEVSREYGATVVERPAEISSDTASSESAVLHAAAEIEEVAGRPPGIVVLLQCTAPFVTPAEIDATIEPVFAGRADSAFAAVPFSHFLWNRDDAGFALGINHGPGLRVRRQDLKPQYLESGSVYAMDYPTLVAEGTRFCGRTAINEAEADRCFEIDSPSDLAHARILARELDAPVDRSVLPDRPHAVVFDFDGVFTDNMVYVSQDGIESVRASRSDGMGIEALRRKGIPLLVLSKERNPVVEARCRKLDLPFRQGIDDKLSVLKEWLDEVGANPDQTIYVGNDVNDLECLSFVGYPAGPSDSHPRVQGELRLRLAARGGNGAIRELAELICQPK